MPKEHLNPPELFPSLQYGFSQVVTTTPGKMIFVSGQVAWDAQQNLVGSNDLKEQTLQSLRNVEKALHAAGGTLTDIVSMRLYIVDYASEKAPAIKDALLTTFGSRRPPACTWIGVSALADEGFMIEIEVVAVLAEE